MTFESRLRRVKWAVLVILLAVPLRLASLQWGWRTELNFHPYNSRLAERVAFRGQVVDRRGRVVASSVGARRIYPAGALAAHWTGFYSGQFGLAGIERWKQELLRERREEDGVTSRPGKRLRLSLDLDVQARVAAQFPLAVNGAALVVDLDSGQVLAAVSHPTFEPSRVEVDWKGWQKHAGSPLLNRCFLGLYPAGELWSRWDFRALGRRPAALMDWCGAQEVRGHWLVSPGQVAALLLRAGSPLPLSQLYSEHRRAWVAPALEGEWSQAVRMEKQVVSWAIVVRPPYAVVSVWEDWAEPKSALAAARRSIP